MSNDLIESIKQQIEGFVRQMPIPSEAKTDFVYKMKEIEILAGHPQILFNDSALENYYIDLNIYNKEFFRTVFNLKRFLIRKYGERISKPIKETEWQTFFDASITNSYYSYEQKKIFIHQKDLKNPIFNVNLPSYLNFAKLGWQISNMYGFALMFEVNIFKKI